MTNSEIYARVNACIIELEAIAATGTHTIVEHLKVIRKETGPYDGSGSDRYEAGDWTQSNGEGYEAGDWTQSNGEGLTDDVSAKDVTTLPEPTSKATAPNA
jgi:hypothetical protein